MQPIGSQGWVQLTVLVGELRIEIEIVRALLLSDRSKLVIELPNPLIEPAGASGQNRLENQLGLWV